MPTLKMPQPTQDAEAAKAALTKLLQAAADVGVALDPQGFAQFWVTDSARVVVAYEGEKATGLGMFTFGRRFFDGDLSASVLLAEGADRVAVLQHIRNVAEVLGATKIFYEGDELGGETAEMRVVTVG